MTTVYAPFLLQGGRIEPYVSVNEVKFSPTASALDFSDLVPNGNQTVQDRALYELIVRASSKIDTYTMGKYGTLNATLNTENGRYRLDRQGRFKVHPSFTPVIAVTNFTWGALMGQTTSVPVSTFNCFIERDEIVVQAYGAAQVNAVAGMQALSYIVGQPYDGSYYCQWTYVNGWANSFTTTSTAVSDTAVVVKDPTGIVANMQLTLWDGMNDETVYVGSSYNGISLTVPLASPLAYAHGVGCNLSALPPIIKQACIHFVCHLVVERGQGGLQIGPEGHITATGSPGSGLGSHHEAAAYDLLDEFRSPSGRT